MKKIIFFFLLFLCEISLAQKRIRDKAVENQQNRMVFKEWDKKKFTPVPHWYDPISLVLFVATWVPYLSYMKGPDLRPLRVGGEQTIREAIAENHRLSTEEYKKYSDSLKKAAQNKFLSHHPSIAKFDPLYLIFYKKQLIGLEQYEQNAFYNVDDKLKDFMKNKDQHRQYLKEMELLLDRYNNAKKTFLERGQRIILMHNIYLDYRKTLASWKQQIETNSTFLKVLNTINQNPSAKKGQNKEISDIKSVYDFKKKDIELMRELIKNFKKQ